MTVFAAILKAAELALSLAMKVDSALSARKAKKAKGLTYKDVQHIQKQIDSATSHKVKP